MLNNKLLSIEIGTQNIKIVEGVKKGKNIEIHKASSVKTPENSFNDGMITNMIAMKAEINKAISDENMKCKSVVFTVKSTAVITRIITIPYAKPSEMQLIVKNQMQQYLPINFDDYIVKFILLEKIKQENNSFSAKVRVVVFPNEMAKKYLDLAKELKLNPTALDLSSNAIRKLSSHHFNNNENNSSNETVAIIDMGCEFLQLNIVSKGNNEFTRNISSGGRYIDVDISRQVGLDMVSAEKEKIDKCDLSKDVFDDDNISMINSIIKMVVDDWVREIYKLLEYYNNSNEREHIEKIYIHGGSSALNGIEEYMINSIKLPIIKINNLNNIIFKNPNLEKDLVHYLNNIGAIIRL